MPTGAVGFTKGNAHNAGARVPVLSASENDCRGMEAYSSLPFVSAAAAQAENMAVVSINDSGQHYIVCSDDVTTGNIAAKIAAGNVLPVTGPGNFSVSCGIGEKIGVSA